MKLVQRALFFAVFAAFLGIFGCGKVSKKTKDNAVEIPEFTGPAIKCECVVTYYGQDTSKYYTTQEHIIYPQIGAIEISAHEPEGDFKWYLKNGVYTAVMPDSVETPFDFCTTEIAHAVLLSVLAGGGFIDEMPGLVKPPVNISGQWYQPIQILPGVEDPITQTVLKNSTNGDVVWTNIYNENKDYRIAARNYNRLTLENYNHLVPTAIDIYETDKASNPTSRLIKFEYKSIEFEDISN